jgi:dihydroorotase
VTIKQSKIAFINGKLLDHKNNTLQRTNLLLQNGLLTGLGYLPDDDKDCLVYDISGCIIVPNIVDSYAHLKEPGAEIQETFTTASQAASQSGITSIMCTPTCNPPIDNPEILSTVIELAKQKAQINILPIGAATKQTAGQELAQIGLMKSIGISALSDTTYIDSISLMQNILKYAAMCQTTFISVPTNTYLGDINEGYYSTILGLKPIPAVFEEICVMRDIMLAKYYQVPLHIFPISTSGSVAHIKKAKQDGLNITCGTTPYYLYFADEDLQNYDTNLKVNPPLRTKQDQQALIQGLKNDTIDLLASNHHPLTIDQKRTDFAAAEFGISSLDMFVPIIIQKLIHEEKFDPIKVFSKISRNPQQIFQLALPKFALNKKPSFSIFNLNQSKKYNATDLKSKGVNNPFLGYNIQGVCLTTVVNGAIIYQDPTLKCQNQK